MFKNLLKLLFCQSNYIKLLNTSAYSDSELDNIERLLKSHNIRFNYNIPRLIIFEEMTKKDLIKVNRKIAKSAKKYIRKGNYFPIQYLLILRSNEPNVLKLLSLNGVKCFSD